VGEGLDIAARAGGEEHEMRHGYSARYTYALPGPTAMILA